ncbi:MAG: PH domain-containing protein [Clostridia bacterium]|nr:PH domain-containing protein [Clostridia bacterium]
MTLEPEYVAKKSAWKAVTLFRVLFFWLIIPLIIMIVDIVKLKNQKIEFYENYIVEKSGVIAKHERKSTFRGIISVSVNQSIHGRMFDYGDLSVDVIGKWDINTTGIADPKHLKKYLDSRMINPAHSQTTAVFYA